MIGVVTSYLAKPVGNPLFIGLGVLAIFVFVALGPAHLRSDFLRTGVDRYIAQWVGVAWLTAGALLARLAPPAAAANAAIAAHRGS